MPASKRSNQTLTHFTVTTPDRSAREVSRQLQEELERTREEILGGTVRGRPQVIPFPDRRPTPSPVGESPLTAAGARYVQEMQRNMTDNFREMMNAHFVFQDPPSTAARNKEPEVKENMLETVKRGKRRVRVGG
jgi:hypothetical protein